MMISLSRTFTVLDREIEQTEGGGERERFTARSLLEMTPNKGAFLKPVCGSIYS